MDLLFLVARVLHVLLGAFWAGALIFNAIFLLPSMRDAGADAAKVAAGLTRRRFIDIMPVVALVTIVTGLYLYWHNSSGFSPAYMHSSIGMTYAFGAVASIVALGLGAGILRPSMKRAGSLTQAMSTMSPEDAARTGAEVQALRAKVGKIGVIVAWLLAFTVITMALGRYV